ncbi:filaggrin-2 [Diachasma alloeum]|uniref:filaggrin-2 n=1 Tax=Diachasma alloeum TaxID=454923 RepID=UPI00073844D5|nr:filaggrin-2 [Diachasma alloeum]
MAFKLAIIFCAIAAQTFGAPKPCYTNCATSGSTFSHESMTGISTHGNFMAQQNAAFQQLHQSLMNQLQEAHHLDYSQPGTWQKNAAYKTDDGAQVYQEHGKVETDNAQMRYFKKNYTKSWGSGGGGLSNDLLSTQGRLTGGGYSGGSSHHESHHQNWEINSNGQHSQNIEDLGVQQIPTTQVSNNVIRNFEEMARNLESYISQCTERVQMGQLSNYQSYTDVVQQHLDQMKQTIRDNGLWNRLIGQINSLETKLNELKVQAQHSANLIHTGSTSSHGSNTVVASGVHQPVITQVPVGESIRQDEEYKGRVSMTSSYPAPIQSVPSQSQQYASGASGGYQQSYQYGSHGQSGYVSSSQDLSSGANQHGDYTQHAGYGQQAGGQSYAQGHTGYGQSTADYTQGTVGYNQHNAGYSQHNAGYNQHNTAYNPHNAGYNRHNAEYNQHNAGYNQHTEQVYPVHTSPAKTVEESWNASGSRKETTYGASHVLEPIRSAGSRCRGADGQYNSWCTSNSGQTESINYGGQGSGCQGAAYGTLCKRYKRENKDDFSQQTEDLTQQTEDLTQQTEDLTQQTEDLTQQTEDLSQHVGSLQVGSQRGDQGGNKQNVQGGTDFNDQSGSIEFGNQYGQRRDRNGHRGQGVHGHEQHGHDDGDQDYTQQTQDSDNFSHQHQHHGRGHGHHGHGHRGHGVHGHEQHGHNDGDQDFTQQTQGFEDFSQQQTGNFGFESHHQHGHHGHGVHGHEQHGHNDGDYRYNQQGGRFDYSQQQSGNSQLGQQQIQQSGGTGFDQQNHRNQGRGSYGGYSQQTEDLTQQTQGFEDLTQQQTTDGFGFGQQNQQPDHSGRYGGYSQQTQDFNQQQTTGNHQFGQQQTGNQRGSSGHYGGYSQQTEDLSQQTQSFGDLTQQTGNYGQQTENLNQQTQSFDDLTQQTTGNVGFGQQQTGNLQSGNQRRNPGRYGGYGQQTGDLNQQTQSFDDLTQQTTGDLGIGQKPSGNLQSGNQRRNPGRYGGYGQQTEDLSQQTQSFGDLMQQTTGNLGFEQQQTGNLEFGNQQRDLSQQTQSFDHLIQQTTENLGFGNQLENSGHYRGDGQQTEDLSQQTQSFGDLTQQTTGNFGFEQQHTGRLEFGDEQRDLNQQIQSFPGSTQQSDPLAVGNERPAPKPPVRGQVRNGGRADSTAAQDTPLTPVKGGRRRPAPQNTYPQPSQNSDALGVISIEDQLQQTTGTQWHNSHQPSDLTNENYQQGTLDGSQNPQISHNEQQNATDTEILFQPRILEAYGGKGPYDVNHNDNIFSGVKPNPTATLSPMSDSWDIREKPNDIAHRNNNYPTFAGAPDRAPRYDWEETTTTTTPAPGFWKRVGNKIATTYERTKEKITSSLG